MSLTQEFVIYRALSPSGKSYIGLTSNYEKRQYDHKYDAEKLRSNKPFHKAIRKYRDEIVWEVLEKGNGLEWAQIAEKKWINEFDTYNNGYNLTLGGEGALGFPTNLGRTLTDETKEKIRQSLVGKKHFETRKNNQSKSQIKTFQNSIPDEHLQNLKKAAIKNNKYFYVFKDNKLIGEWNNQRQCAKDLSLQYSCINRCLKRLVKQHKGCTFKYMEQINE